MQVFTSCVRSAFPLEVLQPSPPYLQSPSRQSCGRPCWTAPPDTHSQQRMSKLPQTDNKKILNFNVTEIVKVIIILIIFYLIFWLYTLTIKHYKFKSNILNAKSEFRHLNAIMYNMKNYTVKLLVFLKMNLKRMLQNRKVSMHN